MPEENDNQSAEDKVEKTGEDNADENKNNAAEGAGEGADKAGEEEKENNKDDKNSHDDGDKDPDVKPRKSVKDYIIERKDRKIKKLEEKLNKSGEEEGDDDDGQGDDADDLSEEKIDKVVSAKYGPVMEATIKKSLEAEDKAEVEAFVKANPDFAPYQAKAEKFMKHPSRRQLPIESIFYEVAGKDLMKIGAGRQKQADDDAKRSNAGGGTGGNEGAKSVKDMTPAEFAAHKEEIRSRRRE